MSNCSGILQWDWDTAKGQFKANKIQVQEVSAKVFYDLIKDWYGIELSCLNKDDFILLKAAAEPKDPTLDRDDYQGSFKIPASDTASEGAVSKIKPLEYKQKHVLNYSKITTSLDKMSSNKTLSVKVDEVISQALHEHLKSKELMSSLGKLFGPTDNNKSSEEIMSFLKTIRSGLIGNEERICSNRLHLKDPNKHFMKGNVLSIDDLFNGILDRVNDAAIQNDRKDILATLQQYSYDSQEQVNIIGDA
ncbi:hypothetical protein [Candidatus Tisiphia endosymbiont of Ceraclea dissimilis]|uniref:hypothetical protein n=1 Tax=Candidatus Tisiphia endosymbiont of Ceraclea dissimilis TaxID=3077928 RepID=UPI003CCB6ED6